MNLNKQENKKEILELYEKHKSSDVVAEILAEKYDIIEISTASLARKIRKWLIDYADNGDIPSKLSEKVKTTAKVLLYDIETSPLVAYLWSKWQQGIQDDDIIEDWSILCFSAKWLFEDKIMSFRLTEEELKTRDDSRIVKELWKLMDEADIIIGHNHQKFDNKKSNTKFLKYGLNLPSSYQNIDTLLHARKKFGITSNKLDYIGSYLNLGRKVETPKGMWREVMQGNYDMLIKMDEYCQGDVKLLEDIYLYMRPYIQPHPNMGLFVEDNVKSCTCCGSKNLTDLDKKYSTTVNQYTLYRCDDCGSLMRSRESSMTVEQRKFILSSTPQ